MSDTEPRTSEQTMTDERQAGLREALEIIAAPPSKDAPDAIGVSARNIARAALAAAQVPAQEERLREAAIEYINAVTDYLDPENQYTMSVSPRPLKTVPRTITESRRHAMLEALAALTGALSGSSRRSRD